jgi:hypothetical protein
MLILCCRAGQTLEMTAGFVGTDGRQKGKAQPEQLKQVLRFVRTQVYGIGGCL